MKPIYKLGLALATILALMIGVALAATQYSSTTAATAANSNVAFGAAYPYVLIINDGPNTVYFDLSGDGVATTANAPLKIGESFSAPRGGYIAVGLICAAAETASVRVVAIKDTP